MNYKMITIALLLLVITTLLIGCSSKKEAEALQHQTITASQAMEMMEESTDHIILDVRTKEEYDTGHIENAILLPNEEITEKAEAMLTDKNARILVYCRSGRRSALAAKELVSLGYSDVIDFGGINDWPYDIVYE